MLKKDRIISFPTLSWRQNERQNSKGGLILGGIQSEARTIAQSSITILSLGRMASLCRLKRRNQAKRAIWVRMPPCPDSGLVGRSLRQANWCRS